MLVWHIRVWLCHRPVTVNTDLLTDWRPVPGAVMAAPSASLFLLGSPEQNSPGVTSVLLVEGVEMLNYNILMQIPHIFHKRQQRNSKRKKKSINASLAFFPPAPFQTPQLVLCLCGGWQCILPPLNFSSLIHIFSAESVGRGSAAAESLRFT